MAFDPLPETTAAGGYSRISNKGGVSDLFSSPPEYGASLAAFNTWKRFGIATSQMQQSTTFGRSSTFGGSGNGKAPPRYDPRHTDRNPISWEGADLLAKPDEHNRYTTAGFNPLLPPQPAEAGGAAEAHMGAPSQPMDASAMWAQANGKPAPTARSIQLQEEQMQQTWGALMRNGAVKPSAAMALVDSNYLPKAYSSELMGEAPAKGSYAGSSMHAIGLGGQPGSHTNNKVSSKFTSQFHDPYGV